MMKLFKFKKVKAWDNNGVIYIKLGGLDHLLSLSLIPTDASKRIVDIWDDHEGFESNIKKVGE